MTLTKKHRIILVAISVVLGFALVPVSMRLMHGPLTLSEESLKNIAYDTDEEGRPMTLRNGSYREPITWSERWETLTDWVKGDADSPIAYRASREEITYGKSVIGTVRKTPVAAVLHWSSVGGSGTDYTISAVVIRDGEPVITGGSGLGDRPRVRDIRFDGENLLVDLVRAGPDDSMAEPKEHVLLTYAFGPAMNLVEVSTKPLPPVPSLESDEKSADDADSDEDE